MSDKVYSKCLTDRFYHTFNFEKVFEFGWRVGSVQHDFLGTKFRIIFVPIEPVQKALDNYVNLLDYLKTCPNCDSDSEYYDGRYPISIVCDFLI